MTGSRTEAGNTQGKPGTLAAPESKEVINTKTTAATRSTMMGLCQGDRKPAEKLPTAKVKTI